MKYDINLDPAAANTSHIKILDLIPPGSRVLDVGCSTGYLARALVERGCTVSGVEVDPEAAEVARPALVELVVGDLETMDLVDAFGGARFDRIVFADVLEHLRAPLDVLRQAPALLAPQGAVVASIPNVAHASVRLALLQGRFEYRDLGLLDDTHLRFFTRRSVDELHRLAGLMPVEYRRTTAPPFATEIPVAEGDFSPELVADVASDPESSTYQFIVRSVPEGERPPAGDDLAAELIARDQELQEARSFLRVAGEVAARTGPPAVGVLTPAHGPLNEIRRLVVLHELRRRLPGHDLRAYAWGSDEPVPGADGRPVRPFTVDGSPPARTAGALSAVVFTGDWPEASLSSLTPRIDDEGCPWHLAGTIGGGRTGASRPPAAVTGSPGAGCPDPLLLAARVWPADLVSGRAAWLRASGRLPSGPAGHVLVDLTSTPPLAAERALATLIDAGHEELTRSDGLGALELVAAIGSARLVVTDDPGLLWLSLALRTPCTGVTGSDPGPFAAVVAWTDDPDLVVPSPAGVVVARPVAERRAKGEDLGRAVDELELLLDDVADRLAADGKALAASLPTRLAEALERAEVAEAVGESLRLQLDRHRRAAAELALRPVALPGDPAGEGRARALEDRLAAAESESARLRAIIEATNSTLTMRALNPARKAYGRIRALR